MSVKTAKGITLVLPFYSLPDKVRVVCILPRNRTEIANGRFDTDFLLKFNEGVQREITEIFGRAMGHQFLRGDASVLGNKEFLQFFHIVARDAPIEIAGENEIG